MTWSDGYIEQRQSRRETTGVRTPPIFYSASENHLSSGKAAKTGSSLPGAAESNHKDCSWLSAMYKREDFGLGLEHPVLVSPLTPHQYSQFSEVPQTHARTARNHLPVSQHHWVPARVNSPGRRTQRKEAGGLVMFIRLNSRGEHWPFTQNLPTWSGGWWWNGGRGITQLLSLTCFSRFWQF